MDESIGYNWLLENSTVISIRQILIAHNLCVCVCVVCVGRLSVELMWYWLMRVRAFNVNGPLCDEIIFVAAFIFHSPALILSLLILLPISSLKWNWLQMCVCLSYIYLRHSPHYHRTITKCEKYSTVPHILFHVYSKRNIFNPTKSLLNAISLRMAQSHSFIPPFPICSTARRTQISIVLVLFIWINFT